MSNENENVLEGAMKAIAERHRIETEIDKIERLVQNDNVFYREVVTTLSLQIVQAGLNHVDNVERNFDDVDSYSIAQSYFHFKEGMAILEIWNNCLESAIDLWTCFHCDTCVTYSDETPSERSGELYCQSCYDEYVDCSMCQENSYIGDLMVRNDYNDLSSLVNFFNDRGLSHEDAENAYNEGEYGDLCQNCGQALFDRLCENNAEVNDRVLNFRRNLQQELSARRQAQGLEIDGQLVYGNSNAQPFILTRSSLDRMAQLPPIQHRRHTPITIGDSTIGETVKSLRGWSCEIEHYYTNKAKALQAYNSLPSAFGITNDGSLNSSGRTIDGMIAREGLEVQTPILKGKQGEDVLRQVLTTFQKADFRVDQTCGLHVHLDLTEEIERGGRAKTLFLKKIMAFYITFESTIESFLPSSRRGNRYCRDIRSQYSLPSLLIVGSMEELMAWWYKSMPEHFRGYNRTNSNHNSNTRYFGVNFHCALNCNNLEIRHHSGTLNAQKVFEWVNLHTAILDWCSDPSNSINTIEDIYKELTDSLSIAKLDKLFKLLKLEDASKRYFIERHRKFANQANDTFESDMSIPDKKFEEFPSATIVGTGDIPLQVNQNELEKCVA